MRQTTAEESREKQTKADVWHFRDLLVWQKAMSLTTDVYRLTASFPKAEKFGLTSQIRRASISVPSNIAEGCGRISPKSMRVFLGHARGSLYELETQLRIAANLSYMESADGQPLIERCWEITRMLNALIKHLESEHASSHRI